MDFSINREVLLDNLNIISKGLPTRTPMPILTGIKMEIVKQDLYLTSSNADISIQLMISDQSLNVSETGGTVVPGKFFIDIIRKCDSPEISISLLEDKILLIKANRIEYKLRVMDVLEYPKINFVSLENPLPIHSKLLYSIIKETAFTSSTASEKNPILTGVNFNLEDQTLTCVSTDSFRLSRKIISMNSSYPSFNITVPNKSLSELEKILEPLDMDIDLYFSKNILLFKYNNVLFQTRLLEGNYPDTSKLITSNFPIVVKFNRDALLEAVSRVSLLSDRDSKTDAAINYNIIKLTIDSNKKIIMSSNNSKIGDAKEELIPTSNEISAPLTIGFSSKYIQDALRSFDSNEITLNFTGEVRPFIVTSETNETLTQLILPVRLS